MSEVTISMIVVGTGHAARRPSASAAADTNVVLGRALYEEMMYTAYRTIEFYHQATRMPHGTSPGGRCVSRERTDGVLHVAGFLAALYTPVRPYGTAAGGPFGPCSGRCAGAAGPARG